MENPKDEIRAYLNKLIKQLQYIKGLDEQLEIIRDWESLDESEARDIGAYFFRLVDYSFSRTILIELCKLFTDREQKSIIDFLKKARENTDSIEPTIFNPLLQEREKLKTEIYCSYIDKQEELIASKDEVINNIKTHRDKLLAHADSEYFSDPEKLYENFPLDIDEIDQLIEIGTKILEEHYLYLLEADMDIKVHSVHGVDSVLQYVRAFKRIVEDKKAGGADYLKYKWDDYKQE